MTAYKYYLFVINISVLVKIQAPLNKKAFKRAPDLPHSSIFNHFLFALSWIKMWIMVWKESADKHDMLDKEKGGRWISGLYWNLPCCILYVHFRGSVSSADADEWHD